MVSTAEPPAVSPVEPTTEPSLLVDRRPVPITPPTSAIPFPRRTRSAVPESMVIDARCRLIREEETGWSVVEFLDALPTGFPPQMHVLPGRELETLEAAAAKDPRAEFRVTGQTTAYRGKAYLLVLNLSRDLPAPPPARPPAPPAETVARDEHAPAAEATANDEAEHVRSTLMRDRPARPIVPAPADPTPQAEESEALPPAAPPAGDIFIDRIVRIARTQGGQWMEARFEADNTLQEQPVLLLPCRLLERAETLDGKMRITGILRRYRGRDYLLLRKVIPERDMGQL
jgi:hypothetical protein